MGRSKAARERAENKNTYKDNLNEQLKAEQKAAYVRCGSPRRVLRAPKDGRSRRKERAWAP